MYDYVVSLFEGVDLERFDFLPGLVIALIVILSVGTAFRWFLTIFNILFK